MNNMELQMKKHEEAIPEENLLMENKSITFS